MRFEDVRGSRGCGGGNRNGIVLLKQQNEPIIATFTLSGFHRRILGSLTSTKVNWAVVCGIRPVF